MRLLDVVTQIALILPRYTDLFSNLLTISSISSSGGTATITTTAAHDLSTGDPVTISNVLTRTPISSISQSGLVFTIQTSVDHDLTSTWPDHDTVDFEGFTSSLWNDSFTLLSVPNRRVFTIQSTNTLPTLNGNEVLLENRVDGVNGIYQATVTAPTAFTISGDFIDSVYSGGTVGSKVRVYGAITLERAMEQYTGQPTSDLWCMVVMNDAEVSKDRSTFSDAIATKVTGDDLRLRVLDGFTVTFIKNTGPDITANNAVDLFRHDLFLPLLKSVYGVRFDTGLSGGDDFKTILSAHGVSLYNKATLAYTYDFEVVMDITADDAVHEGDTRAFRDVDYTLQMGGDDTTDMTIGINLDDDPLP